MPKGHSAKRAPINNKEDDKERIIIKKEAPAGFAGLEPASRPKRKDFENEAEFEKAFYQYNRVYLSAN